MHKSLLTSCIEPLESRIAPAALVVTTLKDITDAAHDTGSLRDAIFKANASTDPVNTITFTVHGTISLTSDLPALSLQTGSALTIDGPVSNKTTGIVINGKGHEIFTIVAGAVTMQDLTVTGGAAGSHAAGDVTKQGGGFYINDSNPVQLTDIKVSNNTESSLFGGGGGIYIAAGSNVTLQNSSVTGNHAGGASSISTVAGGGIMSLGALTVDNSIISGNVASGTSGESAASRGGGIYISGASATLTLSKSTVSGNKVLGSTGINGSFYYDLGNRVYDPAGSGGSASGGGIANAGGTVTISGSTISGNLAQGGYGGLGIPHAKNFAYQLLGNGGSVSGAGIFNGAGGSLTIQGSVVTSNESIVGLGTVNGTATGGGIYSNGTLNGSAVTVSKNNSNFGGGIAVFGTGSILDSAIKGNRARTGGGVQVEASANFTIQDSTIASNTATVTGGGFEISSGATVAIHNDTIALNTDTALVGGTGGGIRVLAGADSVSIISTIIAGNIAQSGADLFSSSAASVVTLGFDLIQKTPVAGTYTDDGSNIFNVNPKLGALANNGGPTLNMLPKTGSQAINAGDNPDGLATDQRGTGFARTVGAATGSGDGTDIGAVEVQATV